MPHEVSLTHLDGDTSATLLIPGAVHLAVGALADELLQREPVAGVGGSVQLHVLGQPAVRHVAAHGSRFALTSHLLTNEMTT